MRNFKPTVLTRMSGFMPCLWCKWLMVTYQSYLEMFGSSWNKCHRTLFIRARLASSVRQQQPSRRGCLEHQWSTWLFDSTTQQSSQHTTKTVINLIVWQHNTQQSPQTTSHNRFALTNHLLMESWVGCIIPYVQYSIQGFPISKLF